MADEMNGEREMDEAAFAKCTTRIAELEALTERLKQEAQIHAQEARTANSTIAEIYQCVTGSTGEPGNWHGAEPVRACIADLRAQLAGRASLAANAGGEPVATIKSWTNGSYWRNYNVVFHRNDLPVGTDLYTHPSPPEGMAGWKLVPIEPTVDQEWEGKEASRRVDSMAEARKIYKAMIAAAPPLASEAKGA